MRTLAKPSAADVRAAKVTPERWARGDVVVGLDGPNDVRKARIISVDPVKRLSLGPELEMAAERWRRLHQGAGLALVPRAASLFRESRGSGRAMPGTGPLSVEYHEAMRAVVSAGDAWARRCRAGGCGLDVRAIAELVVIMGYLAADVAVMRGRVGPDENATKAGLKWVRRRVVVALQALNAAPGEPS